MSLLASLRRQGLPDQALGQLRSLIVSGRLGPGVALVERDLAEQLGVSRTPVREALAALAREGLVSSRGARGLEVAPLDPEEVPRLYPVIAALERCAVVQAPPLAKSRLEDLARINGEFARADESAAGRVALDDRWHGGLISACRQPLVAELIEPLKRRARRYELTYLARRDLSQRSAAEHAAIHAALLAGDHDEAANRLEAHWIGSMEPLLAAVARSSAPRQDGV